MMAAVLWVVLPGLLGAPVLAALPGWRLAAVGNIVVCGVSFLAACHLALAGSGGAMAGAARPDALAVVMVLLTSFTGLTTAWFSRFYIADAAAAGRLGPRALRLYHGGFAGLLGLLLCALLSDNIGLTWIFLELAGFVELLVVMLPASRAAFAAGWRMLVLCGVALLAALFGTALLAVAAGPAALSWPGLAAAAPAGNGMLLDLAFVFLLIGYGTKAGLVPMHHWLADAQAEGPTPVSAILSGLSLNVALVVLLQLRALIGLNEAAGGGAILSGPALMLLGLVSVVVASFSLWPQRDVKRLFAFSTIEQNGICALAFGLGGAAAIVAGLLHMILHTLGRAAIFQSAGLAAQLRGGDGFRQLQGLLRGQRLLALTLLAGAIAVAGLPPFGLFSSEFLLLGALARGPWWLILPLLPGLVVGAVALLSRVLRLCLDEPPAGRPAVVAGPLMLAGAWINLALLLLLGLAMPAAVLAWLRLAAGA